MKKIAIVLPELLMGGTEKVLINLLETIDYSRVSVDLYLFKKEGYLRSLVPNEVHVKYVDIGVADGVSVKALLKSGKFVKAACKYVKRIRLYTGICFTKEDRIRRKEKYDVVAAFQGASHFCKLFASRCLNGRKKLVWIHGNVGNRCNERLFLQFDEIITVSQSTEKWFLETYPKTKGKTRVVYNILDQNRITEKADENVQDMQSDGISIVSVGRLSQEKGFQMVPLIAEKLLNAGYSFHWYLVGEGPMKSEIEESCRALHVDSVVHLLGNKMNPFAYMNRCTVYVQPSYTEGYCTTTNEAKFLCKPIVATDVPGMREQFIHEKNAYIVSRATVEDLFEGVKYLLDHKEIRGQYSSCLKDGQNDQSKIIQAVHDVLEI